MMLSAQMRIKREICLLASRQYPEEFTFGSLDTVGQINDAWEALNVADVLQDYLSEFRCGQVETDLPCEYSRHYESKSVAAKLSDGSWVGWTYWFGGGKYGEPRSVPWMEDAYDLDCVEEEKLVVVRTFTRKS